jgi:hypothetical protein
MLTLRIPRQGDRGVDGNDGARALKHRERGVVGMGHSSEAARGGHGDTGSPVKQRSVPIGLRHFLLLSLGARR